MFYFPGVADPTWLDAHRLLARTGWRVRITPPRGGMDTVINALEQINAQFDITGLRWSLLRPFEATPAQLDRLKALGATVNVVAGATHGRPPPLAAPFRTVVDSGIPAGIHSDGGHFAPINPWITMYFAVTGRNALGELINAGQQITRKEAIRLFTRENAAQLNMEDKIGSIEIGKLADLVSSTGTPSRSATRTSRRSARFSRLWTARSPTTREP